MSTLDRLRVISSSHHDYYFPRATSSRLWTPQPRGSTVPSARANEGVEDVRVSFLGHWICFTTRPNALVDTGQVSAL